ncbi:hypothetical protein BD324DRAFT_652417 [Kockovaella imperatae]|uniref:BHLH domain-containing protein n=1 Tax=Kockovaella imperatae TaxID=4999 RepID=A0A1Y1UB86_9TREE|nr:hypothetical protein BD324DRAFT_652417 [Kockovaella imperatae]ORX35279.1 hypothetical protein BD324DRAFT_652417 [Kockovaella imperatae]
MATSNSPTLAPPTTNLPTTGPAVAGAKPSVPAGATSKPPSKSKPRKRVNTAEKRHQHNAIERARRETLNSKFIHLARLLPALANSRRPSKSAIVNSSITHLTYQREQRLLAVQLLRQLCAERDALLSEVNEWRSHSGYAAKDAAPAWNVQMEELASVEKEVFGTFTNFEGGDDDDNDDMADGNDQSSVHDRSMTDNNASSAVDPLSITPRSLSEGRSAQQSMFAPPPPAQVGLNWSHDFAAAALAAAASQSQSRPPMPSHLTSSGHASSFANFLAEQMDRASTGSPAGSQFAPTVMTPNTTGDANPFQTQTPSPRSSQSAASVNVHADESKPVGQSVPQGWAASQALFFQQQHQQQLQRLQDQQNLAHARQIPDQQYGGASSFPLSAFMNGQSGSSAASSFNSASSLSGQFNNHAFTQQLFASMFPNGSIPSPQHEQINQWRKNALGATQPQAQGGSQMLSNAPSVDELRNAVRTGMGLGLGMASLWSDGQNNPVEGF